MLPFGNFVGELSTQQLPLIHISSRVRTLDLKEKPEATLNMEQLKQMTSRSKSMCSMTLETQVDF